MFSRLAFIFALSCLPVASWALDFGDHSSSTLTTKAWEAMSAQKPEDCVGYAKKCIEMYETQAIEMQAALSDYASGSQDEVAKHWALNDVGTCYFILGQLYEKQGNNEAALAAYKALTEKLKYAQCWDANGWFWKPADAAKERVVALEFDAL